MAWMRRCWRVLVWRGWSDAIRKCCGKLSCLSWQAGGGSAGPYSLTKLQAMKAAAAERLRHGKLPAQTLLDSCPCSPYRIGASRSVVADWAWDPSGERLAVLMAPPHPLKGCLALYAMSLDPFIHARLLGFVRPPIGTPPLAGGPLLRGAVTAHGTFARGALFSVRLGSAEQLVYNLPMYFK